MWVVYLLNTEDGFILPLSPLAFHVSSTPWCPPTQDSITPGLPKPRHSKVRIWAGRRSQLLGQQQFALELGSVFPEGGRGVAGVSVCVCVCVYTTGHRSICQHCWPMTTTVYLESQRVTFSKVSREKIQTLPFSCVLEDV